MVVGANHITASRSGVVVSLQVVRGRRERVGDPLVEISTNPTSASTAGTAVQAVPIGPGEIAGVIMLSPKNSAAPKRPSAASVMAVPTTPRPRRTAAAA